MSEIEEAVAKAIETALVSGSASVGDERLREIARAAIDAYEAEKAKQAAWAEKLGKDSIRRFQENNR